MALVFKRFASQFLNYQKDLKFRTIEMNFRYRWFVVNYVIKPKIENLAFFLSAVFIVLNCRVDNSRNRILDIVS